MTIVPKGVLGLKRSDVCYTHMGENNLMSPIIMSMRAQNISEYIKSLLNLIYGLNRSEGVPHRQEFLGTSPTAVAYQASRCTQALAEMLARRGNRPLTTASFTDCSTRQLSVCQSKGDLSGFPKDENVRFYSVIFFQNFFKKQPLGGRHVRSAVQPLFLHQVVLEGQAGAFHAPHGLA